MAFSDDTIQKVWEKGAVDRNNDPNKFRKDQCGAWILRSAYGDRDAKYGWEIDHINPQSKGGTDAISNLRPLHWKNNASKQDGRLVCVITANGDRNVAV